MGGLLGHLSQWDREILEREGPDAFSPRKPKGWKPSCDKCYYWTGIGGIGKAYKCYCGSCPAKARDNNKREEIPNVLPRKGKVKKDDEDRTGGGNMGSAGRKTVKGRRSPCTRHPRG